jgi:hypothetical protein
MLRSRLLALLLLGPFLAACTHPVARPPIEVRHFAVDWDALGLARQPMDGLTVEGLVLTPAQWPLEASLKRLVQGDFRGVIDAFDLSFHSSRVPAGALERLYEAGYLPAYVRVRNPDAEPHPFWIERLGVEVDDGTGLVPVAPEELPQRFEEVDWAQAGMVLVSAVLLVAIIAAGRRGDVEVRGGANLGHLPGQVFLEGSRGSRRGSRVRPAPAAPRADPALLRNERLQPGEQREGFVLFRVTGSVVNWKSARLVTW